MLALPIPTPADRALHSGYSDSNPFVWDGFLRDFLDIASFLRGDELSPIGDLLAAGAIEPPLASGASTSPMTVTIVSAAQMPDLGVLIEGTGPDRVPGIDEQALKSNLGLLPPTTEAEPASGLRVDAAPSVDAIVTVQAIANERPSSVDFLPTLQGGPLTIQFDRAPAPAIENAGASAGSVGDTAAAMPTVPAEPIGALEWAPILEAYGGAASAQVSIFDTDGNFDDALLATFIDLPNLPPITPPNGDVLGV